GFPHLWKTCERLVVRWKRGMEQKLERNTWDRVLGKIETRVNPHSFSTWFRPTYFVQEDAANLFVRVPNTWFAEWLRTNYLAVIPDALGERERPGLSVEFVAERGSASGARGGQGAKPVPREPERAAVPSGDGLPGGLNPRYTFEKFVVSSCNQFAHAAAMAVAGQPSRTYNPRYVYAGGAG